MLSVVPASHRAFVSRGDPFCAVLLRPTLYLIFNLNMTMVSYLLCPPGVPCARVWYINIMYEYPPGFYPIPDSTLYPLLQQQYASTNVLTWYTLRGTAVYLVYNMYVKRKIEGSLAVKCKTDPVRFVFIRGTSTYCSASTESLPGQLV